MQNMNVELVASMFKNYQSNVLFHLEGTVALDPNEFGSSPLTCTLSYGQLEGAIVRQDKE